MYEIACVAAQYLVESAGYRGLVNRRTYLKLDSLVKTRFEEVPAI